MKKVAIFIALLFSSIGYSTISANAQTGTPSLRADTKRFVSLLRRCNSDMYEPELFKRIILSDALDYGFTLRSLGTSLAGLDRLVLRCNRLNAERLLNKYRTRSEFNEDYAVLFMRHARKSQLSLSYYGLGKKERKELLQLERKDVEHQAALKKMPSKKRSALMNFALQMIIPMILNKSSRPTSRPLPSMPMRVPNGPMNSGPRSVPNGPTRVPTPLPWIY